MKRRIMYVKRAVPHALGNAEAVVAGFRKRFCL